MNSIVFVIRFMSLFLIIGLISCGGSSDSDSDDSPVVPDNSTEIIYTITEKTSSFQEADRLGQWYRASDFDAIGLYLPANRQLELTVNNIEGNRQPQLLVGTYSRYKASDTPTVYNLVAGYNSIIDPDGGLLYIKYVTEDTPSGKVEMNISGGDPIPLYQLGETTHQQWLDMLDSMNFKDAQLISNKMMLVISKDTAMQFKDLSQDEMLIALDNVAEHEDYIAGIDGSSELHQDNVHKLLITETDDDDYYLAANEHRVMFIKSASDRFMDPEKVTTESWGVWHEMGHMRQTVNWDWDEVDEVTVNIYSLAAMYGFNAENNWLKGNGVWDVLIDYFQLPLSERDFNTSEMLSVKARLAMFRQLWLAYGDEFYIKVHKLSREDNASPTPTVGPRYQSTGEDKMAYFMLVSSQASGYNLKDFFTEWGFKLPQEAYDNLDALNLPDPDIDLLGLRE